MITRNNKKLVDGFNDAGKRLLKVVRDSKTIYEYVPPPGYITNGLIQWFDGENNTGTGVHSDTTTTWKDLSGNNWDGTLTNYTAGAPNWLSKALAFNGTNQFVQTQMPLSALGKSFTIYCVASTEVVANYKGIAGDHTGTVTPSAAGLIYGQWQGSQCVFGPYGDTGYMIRWAEGSEVAKTRSVAFCLSVSDFNTGFLTIDGNRQNLTKYGVVTAFSSLMKMCLGRSYNQAGRYLTGTISNFMVYNRALSEAEIAKNFDYDKRRNSFLLNPALTSNTAPSPFVASASSVLGGGYQPYTLFDHVRGTGSFDTVFACNSGKYVNSYGSEWVMLDFNASILLGQIVMRARSTSAAGSTTQLPRSIDYQSALVANNLSSFLTKTDIPQTTTNYGVILNEKLSSSLSARYLKMIVTRNWGSDIFALGEIEYWGRPS